MSTTNTITDRDYVITHTYDASQDLVFRSWIESTRMSQWWGPRIFTNSSEMDVRPGGKYRITMSNAEHGSFPITGEFREITRPTRIVMTMDCTEHPDNWHDMVKPNRAKDDINPAGIMLMTATFEAVDTGTKLTVHIRFDSAEIRDTMVKIGMNDGWSESLDRLGELLAKS